MCVGLMLCAATTTARAQNATKSADATDGGRLAFDATLGRGHGAGGAPSYPDRGLTSVATIFTRRIRASPRGHALAAVAAGAELNFTDLVCLAQEPTPGTLPSCRTYPSSGYIAVLAGWTTHGTQDRGLRLFAGPAATDNGAGFLARADASAPITSHVSFVWRGHILFGPRDVTQRIQVYAWGMGLRIR